MRSVEEWIGSGDDAQIPRRVRLRLWEKAAGHCERCGHKIAVGERWDLDHAKALVLGGEHRESNMRVVCLPCHRDKTKQDVKAKAKSDRVKAKHLGLRKPRKIRAWRNFAGEIVIMPRERR